MQYWLNFKSVKFFYYIIFNITTKKVGDNLNISLTINDYDTLKYVNNNGQSVMLDGLIEKHIEDYIKKIINKRIIYINIYNIY